ncbi:hypothetical protein VT84_33185 [Gemmata sp. SH-PL17]|uniref:phage major capsid protein n=1 Tax=Gemmata sp. SH-PL17 TaxID=1630693 RepID=UPI00078C1A79|nr:hypothetical protein [Gemmata sp. SH-PL17]AMV29297.1 hypothetical protein VT84_33185 [Gemmata sp. SH-PL17]
MLALARQKYQWQASVGADPARVEKIEAGAVGVANWGREYPGPCVIGRGCKFREMSFVVLGGDRKTSVVAARDRNSNRPKPIRGSAMPTFEEWLASLGFPDSSALDATQLANMKLLYQDEYPEAEAPAETAPATDAPPVDAANVSEDDEEERPVTARGNRPAVRANAGANRPVPRDPVAAMNRRVAANQTRIDRITDISARYGNPQIDTGNGRRAGFLAHAIQSNWTPDHAELVAMRASRPNPEPDRNGGAGDNYLPQIIGAAICLTAGMRADRVAADVPAAHRERVMNEATSSQFQGYGIQGLMAATIHAAGRQYHGSRKSNDFVRAALEADRTIRATNPRVAITAASQGFSTVSLSGILGNVANKVLIASYEAQATTWAMFAAVRSYGDFKPVFSYRLDMTGAFKKVGQDGELKHVGMQETGYSNQLATYGAIVNLTRQMQINDDLGAFLAIPAGLGRMSAIRIEEGVYVTLLSNPGNFFSAGNKNLNSGAGSALSIDGLTASETAFMNQVDVNGKPILNVPDRILVPTTLGVTGNNLYKQTSIATDNVVTGNALAYYENPHAGKYRPTVSPYLNNTAIRDQDGAALSGQSGTAWYQFVDPAVRAALVVGFLNGQQTPTIQDADTDFATLGHQWRAFHDFGVGMEDPAAVQKNAGA